MSRGFRHFSDPLQTAIARAKAVYGVLDASPVLVAVSGGPDSFALLHGLANNGWNIHAAHIDHGLRGQASSEDAMWVADFAKRLGVPATIRSVDLATERQRSGGGIEMAARSARYRALGAIAANIGACAIATGHTADDQAETMLMRLIRGSGPAGLAGILPVEHLPRLTGNDLPILRPLLGVGRAEIVQYLSDHQITARHDATNDEPFTVRNRIRSVILPALRRENARVVAALGRLAAHARDQRSYLSTELARHWPSIVLPGRGVAFDRKRFGALHPVMQREAIRFAAERLGAIALMTEQIDRAVAHAQTGSGNRQLAADLVVSCGPDVFVIDQASPPDSVVLSVPGSARIGDWIVEARRDVREVPFAANIIDLDPLIVRVRTPGDRYPGSSGTVKVQDQQRSLDWLPRRHAPVILADDRIVWAVGGQIANWAMGDAIQIRAAYRPAK